MSCCWPQHTRRRAARRPHAKLEPTLTSRNRSGDGNVIGPSSEISPADDAIVTPDATGAVVSGAHAAMDQFHRRCSRRRVPQRPPNSPITDSDSAVYASVPPGALNVAPRRAPNAYRRWSTPIRAWHHENRTPNDAAASSAYETLAPGEILGGANQTVAFPGAGDPPVAQVQSQHDAVAEIDPSAQTEARAHVGRVRNFELEPSLVEGNRGCPSAGRRDERTRRWRQAARKRRARAP